MVVREWQSTLSRTRTREHFRFAFKMFKRNIKVQLTFDNLYFQDIEKFYNTQIDEMPMNVADLI